MSEASKKAAAGPCSREKIEVAIDQFQHDHEADSSFRRLFDCYYRQIYAYFQRKSGDIFAEDLTQDTFLRVYRGLKGFRKQARFETWLYRVASNTYQKQRERYAEAQALPEQEDWAETLLDPDPSQDQQEQLLEQERRRLLLAAIATMPSQRRRCAELRLQGYKEKEVAVLMRLSIGTVKAHLAQARRQLREQLTETLGTKR